jgi:outer membrane protein TolC
VAVKVGLRCLLIFLLFATPVSGQGGTELERSVAAIVSGSRSATANAADRETVVGKNAIPMNTAKLIELVKKNNASVLSSRLLALKSEKEGNADFSKFLPTVTLSAGYEKVFGRYIYSESPNKKVGIDDKDKNTSSDTFSANLMANYNVFNSGRDLFSHNFHKHKVEAAKYEEYHKIEEAVVSALTLYFHILLLEAQRKAQLDDQNAKGEIRLMAETKEKLGSLSPDDKLKVDSNYLNAKISTATIDKLIREKRIELNLHHLGLGPDQDLVLDRPEANEQNIGKIDIDRQIENALGSDVQLKKLEETKKQLEESLKLAKLSMAPLITVNMSAGIDGNDSKITNMSHENNGQHKNVSATANMNARLDFPIFAGFGNLNNLRAVRKDLENCDVLIEERKRTIRGSVIDIVNNISYHSEIIPSRERNLGLQKKIFRGALNSYRNGGYAMTDVLQEKSKLEKAESDLLTEKYNLLISRLELLKLTGRLTVENVINLGGF